MAQIPDLAHADGTTKPLPVSAYVVIIDRNEAAINSNTLSFIIENKSSLKFLYITLFFFYKTLSNGQCGIDSSQEHNINNGFECIR